MLLTLTHYSTIFNQLLHYFRDSSEALFNLVVTSDVDDIEVLNCIK
jgi:hypothetical protein